MTALRVAHGSLRSLIYLFVRKGQGLLVRLLIMFCKSICFFKFNLLLIVFFNHMALSVEDLEEFVRAFYQFLFVFVYEKWPHDHLVEAV